MKKTNNILTIIESFISKLLVLSSLFLLQCNDAVEKDKLSIVKRASSEFTTITGYIHNRDIYPNTKDMIVNVSHVSGENRVTQIKSPINDDGTFYFEIDLARPQDVTMQPHLDFLYLIPGDSLHVEIDFKNLQDVRLSGGRSVEINHDFSKYFNATGYRTTLSSYAGVGTNGEAYNSWAQIREQLDEERSHYRSKRQSFLEETQVCDEVAFLTEAMIELDYYESLIGTMGRREAWGRVTMDKESIMNELNEVAGKYFHSDFYSNAHFKFMASAYIPGAMLATRPEIGTYVGLAKESEAHFLTWAKEVTKTEVIKDFMLTVMAGTSLVHRDLDNFEKYSTHISNAYLIDRLMQEYRTTRTKMQNPEDISAYILGNPRDFLNSISFGDNNLLKNKIASNGEKVHVINIGAAWCPPCKPVIEQLAALMKEYADKDVCFSFICVSGNNEATRAMYRERGIDDKTVYFSTDDDWLFLQSKFAPISFPYGVLMNKKGVIVDYGSHVRPGEMLLKKIDLLLEQDVLVK